MRGTGRGRRGAGLLSGLAWRPASGAWVNISAPLIPPPADFKTTWCVTNLADGTACDLRAVALDLNGASVTSDVVTVTIDASTGKVPGSGTEGDKDGKHTKQETFSHDETAKVDVYDGTSVTVPLGTVSSNITVEVELTGTNTNPDAGAAYGRSNINMNRKVTLDGHPDLSKPITITIPYPDDDNDGIVDGTAIPENTLTAYWFDTTDGKWKKPLSCEVDTVANLVRITTYHLTEFGLYGSRNLLLPANGGTLKSCSFAGTNVTSAANLTDGNTASYWQGPTNAGPQEFVYSFTNYQGAVCSEVVIYNGTQGMSNYCRDFQILVSMDVDGATFRSVTNGVLPMADGPVVVAMGGVTCRVFKVVVSSGCGAQYGLAELELHGSITADPNGNGMPDAWEMQYFGSVARSGADDYDTDNLNDINEYLVGANPTNMDTDGDDIPDGWEIQYGLQVATNDAAADADGDGMSNLQEFIAGTDPTNPASVLRLSVPEKIGPWIQNVFWDTRNFVWRTGAWQRVEGMVFSWPTLSGRVYRVNSTTNLLEPWTPYSQDFVGGSDVRFTNDWATNSLQRFFQLQVDKLP